MCTGSVFPSHTFTFRRQLGTDNNGGFHEQVSRHVLDSDRQRLVWPRSTPRYEHADEMVDKFRMRGTDTQLIDPLVHITPNDYECDVPSNCNQTCVPLERRIHCNIVLLCRSWIYLRLTGTKNRLRSGKQRTMSRGDHWIHVKSKMPVRRK